MTRFRVHSWRSCVTSRLLFLLVVPITFICITAGVPSLASAQVKRCECSFADPQWQAYGTKGACSIWMKEGKQECEVEFGGFGAEPEMISRVLRLEVMDYYAEVSNTVSAYMKLRYSGDSQLTSPEFLRRALPVLMRGAFLRGSTSDSPVEELTILNSAIERYVGTYAEEISRIFRGEQDPGVISGKEIGISGITFETDSGVITTVIDRDDLRGTMITVYLPQGG